MEIEVYKTAYEKKDSHWWFLGRARIITAMAKKYLANTNKRILDVGCGASTSLTILSEFGSVEGVDSSKEALRFCQGKGYAKLGLGKAELLPHRANEFDLVAALDLLEHVQEDKQALGEFFRVCRDGGWLVLTVPGFPCLWGENDVATHHFRRYKLEDLKTKVENAGFVVKKISYFNTLMFVPFAVWNLFQKMRNVFAPHKPQSFLNIDIPVIINQLLLGAFSLEALVLPQVNFPFGISIICFAKKIKND